MAIYQAESILFAKRFIAWKEIGCSLIHDHTSARHHFHQTQPPHTVILRSAQEDNAKRFIVWKEIGCSLIHDHTFAPHHFHQTQPPHTVILSEAKDPDFRCCPSLNNIFNTNIQVLRSAQDDSRGRVVLKHRMTLQRGL